MAQNDNDHPYPFMQVQNPTLVGTSTSRNVQDSGSCSSNHGERSASASATGVQGLASCMDALTLHRSRVIGAANQVHQHCCRPKGAFLVSPGYEQCFVHHNVEPFWVSLAKDPRGYRSLQKKIDNATPQQLSDILNELKDHLHELMIHPLGHYVVQTIFQTANISVAQRNAIINLVVVDVQKLKDVCMDHQGNRVIKKMLENVETPYMMDIITIAMKCITVALMNNVSGGYVIEQFLKVFPPVNKKVILDVVAKNCAYIATDPCGCCVIQKCMDHAEVEPFVQLVNGIISNAVVLAEDPYGNYVLQFLVKKKITVINRMLILRLCNKYVALSTNKYASNVVEDLLQFSNTEDTAVITLELMYSPEFLNVLRHPYGNYAVQRALQYTKGSLHVSLCNIILSKYEHLQSCLYGKRVLAFAKACKVKGLQNSVSTSLA